MGKKYLWYISQNREIAHIIIIYHIIWQYTSDMTEDLNTCDQNCKCTNHIIINLHIFVIIYITHKRQTAKRVHVSLDIYSLLSGSTEGITWTSG